MLKQAPNHPLVLLRWGEYLERRGDFKAARKPLQDAATLVGSEPSTLRIHLRYGRNLELNGRYKPAEKEYRLALQIDPGNAVGYLYLGNLLRKQRRYDEAQSVVDAGLTIPNLTTVVVDQLRDLRARINGGGL